MIKEKYITSITIQEIEYQIHKQNMWLIMSCNNKEIDRIELFNQSVDEAIDDMVNRRPTNYALLVKEADKTAFLSKTFENLCAYDIRNPHNVIDTEFGSDEPTKEPCMCDNCFYGRTTLALEIIRLNEALQVVK